MSKLICRHLPEAILIPCVILAGLVTSLSDIPEKWPFGHELGIGVASISFAYIGAYIFNWLVVEVPRAQALEDLYDAAKGYLESMLVLPSAMVTNISGEVDPANYAWSASEEQLRKYLQQIDWEHRLAHNDFQMIEGLAQTVEEHREAYLALAPLLGSLEPSVATAVARLNACPIFKNVDNLDKVRHRIIEDSVQRGVSRNLNDYQVRARELNQKLNDSNSPSAKMDRNFWGDRLSYPEAVAPTRKRPGS